MSYLGNVSRFINHACNHTANLSAQMVLLEGCSGVFHHVAFFATRDIKKYTELTYHYGEQKGADGVDVHCGCGNVNCDDQNK